MGARIARRRQPRGVRPGGRPPEPGWDGRGLAGSTVMTDSFPRQHARTRNFSLGVPRSFQVSPDGSRIVFLRGKGGSDPVTCLWVLDLHADPRNTDAAAERLVV